METMQSFKVFINGNRRVIVNSLNQKKIIFIEFLCFEGESVIILNHFYYIKYLLTDFLYFECEKPENF